MTFCHDLTLAQSRLLSKAFVLNVPGSVEVPFNPSVIFVLTVPYLRAQTASICGFSMCFKLSMQVGKFSPDNFTLCCLGFLWVFQQKWVQRDVESALPWADGSCAGSPATEEPAQPEEVTFPLLPRLPHDLKVILSQKYRKSDHCAHGQTQNLFGFAPDSIPTSAPLLLPVLAQYLLLTAWQPQGWACLIFYLAVILSHLNHCLAIPSWHFHHFFCCPFLPA